MWPWLVARPIAHRGLHNKDHGIIENSVRAARAAVAGGYAIECDVQMSLDGEAIVFHDETLERLTAAQARVDALTSSALAQIPLIGSADCPVSLSTFCDGIAGQVPLIVEIKSRFDGDMRLADRVAAIVSARQDPIALKSFDPAIIVHLRARLAAQHVTHVPLGIVGQAKFDHAEWAHLTTAQKREMESLSHWPQTQPDFLSWSVQDLPHAATVLMRAGLQRPLMTWTVRTPEQLATARQWADQPVFEGLLP